MEDAPDCSQFQSQNVQMYGYDTNGRNHGRTLKIQWHLLSENLYGHPLAGLLWERQFEEILSGLGWEKYRIGNVFFVHRKQRLFSSVHVDDMKMTGGEQNMAHNVDKYEICRTWRTNVIS